MDYYSALLMIIKIFKEWQTLIVGVLALIAAFATIRAIRHQISTQKDQFADIHERNIWAARARMPSALSEICSFASDVAASLLSPGEPHAQPPLKAIDILINSMIYSEKNAAERIAKLVEHFQIHHARLESHYSPSSNQYIDEYHISNMLYDATLLRSYANSLFEYGRRETEHGPTGNLTRENVREGLTNAIGLANIEWENTVYLTTVDLINERYSE